MKPQDQMRPMPAGSVQIGGRIGEQMRRCWERRVRQQPLEPLIRPFREALDGSDGFRCEFWGKWFTSAVLGYAIEPSEHTQAWLHEAVSALLRTQQEDGYIGSYVPHARLGAWDVWGRKYVLLGLLAWYDLSGDERALTAASRALDSLIADFDAQHANVNRLGWPDWKGLPPSSVLEPVALLAQRTGDVRYRAFAERIVSQWSEPGGLRLIESALDGVPAVAIGAPKAYEQMSCVEGLCELYRLTGEQRYLQAALAFAHSVEKTEIMLVGAGCNHELWCQGATYQTEVLEQPIETCVTVTWMKLCLQLLRLTGESHWADALEMTVYNALPAAMTPDGSWWSYYSPLQGERVPSHMQYPDTGLSCCVANGPRGMLLPPQCAVMRSAEGLTINLFTPLQAHTVLDSGVPVDLVIDTEYPRDGEVRISVQPQQPAAFTLDVRIPGWCVGAEVAVNGQPHPVQPGSYVSLKRTWTGRDMVTLTCDMNARAVSIHDGTQLAVVRGPVVLALDNRFNEPTDKAVRLMTHSDGTVDLTPVDPPEGIWMLFEAPFEVRPSHVFNHHTLMLRLCDYASAGNAWSSGNLYRVWLPQPLFLQHAWMPDTWRLQYPDCDTRPACPVESC